jgi:hypothetical protein
MSTTGRQLGLYGWGKAMELAQTVWLCEGEWDKLAADDGIIQSGECAVAVPGANILKMEWLPMFVGKDVIACYDNDEAGEVGSYKAYQRIMPIAKSIKFVHWPATCKDGYDVRDEWKASDINARKKILGYCKKLPKGIKQDGSIAIQEPTAAITDASKQPEGPGVLPELIYAGFEKWLLMPDTLLLDVIFGTVLAHRIPGDPVWMFIVGPPGSGKTEPLDALTGAHNIICKSTLTSKTLVSGQFVGSGIEPSLLPRLHGKILIVKDFTTVLTLEFSALQELRGILRDSYDGKFERDYGNGKMVRWLTHYGFLAGVTAAIEQHANMSASFGERFLNYHLPLSDAMKDRREFVMRAHNNVGKEVEMKKELQQISIAALKHTFNFNIEISHKQRGQLVDMAQCTALLRGTVPRDRITKEITNNAYSELGTRLVKQYTKLAKGISAFHRSTGLVPRAIEAARRIALGSIPTDRKRVIKFLFEKAREDKAATTAEVSEVVGLPPTPTCDRILHDLSMLCAVERSKGTGFTGKYSWSMKPDIFKAFSEGGLFDEIAI